MWNTIIVDPMTNALLFIYSVLVNIVGPNVAFGLGMIVFTILIRLVIWPVYAKSTRTMKRMSKLTPMMTEIKEKYKAQNIILTGPKYWMSA